jgi:hypothetical protein
MEDQSKNLPSGGSLEGRLESDEPLSFPEPPVKDPPLSFPDPPSDDMPFAFPEPPVRD